MPCFSDRPSIRRSSSDPKKRRPGSKGSPHKLNLEVISAFQGLSHKALLPAVETLEMDAGASPLSISSRMDFRNRCLFSRGKWDFLMESSVSEDADSSSSRMQNSSPELRAVMSCGNLVGFWDGTSDSRISFRELWTYSQITTSCMEAHRTPEHDTPDI